MRSALVVAALLVASVARADANECIAQSERAQQARTDLHLRAARTGFQACATPACPDSIRQDCAKSFDEIDRAIPSIVVIVRAGDRDVTDVRVMIDDEVVATKLTGTAIAVDPGPHRVTIDHSAGRATREIIAHVAEKNRVIEFVAAAAPVVQPVSPIEQPVLVRRHTAYPWIVAGIGVAVAGAGAALFAVGQSDIAQSRSGCTLSINGSLSCPSPPSNADRTSLDNTGNTLSDVGVIATVVGGIALVTGVVWHFAEPTGPVVALVPIVMPHFAGSTLQVAW